MEIKYENINAIYFVNKKGGYVDMEIGIESINNNYNSISTNMKNEESEKKFSLLKILLM